MLYLVGGPGNAERVDVSDLFVKRLSACGLEIDYVIFSRSPSPAWRKIEWRGATAYEVGRTRLGGISGAIVNKFIELGADFRTCWLALTRPYDIVQIRDKFVVGALCVFATRLRRQRFIYWLSYPYAESRLLDAREGRALVPWLSLIGANAAAWLLYKFIMPRADRVFVQSERMLRDVAANGIREDRMTSVPMAVSEDLLEKPRVAVAPDTVLYLGTLIKVRRLDVLIEALRIVKQERPDARLIFVGDGEDPTDRAFLEERARQLRLTESVEFTGMLPMGDAHERVMSAAVCVSPFYPTPILQSTSPTKLYEYMALGRPVVANHHPEQTVAVAESGAGVCVEWSAEAFAEGILTLLSDPEKAERMGNRGRGYVRQHRIYPVIARSVAAEYGRLLGETAPSVSESR